MVLFKNILCPIVFDQNSQMAMGLGSEVARERKATLHLLHVVTVPPGPEMRLSFSKLEAAARTRLERLASQKIDGSVRYEVEIVMGVPAVEVLEAARRENSDLIVMATHGRKGLSHLVLGSVVEQVIREAPCPVLTVSPTARGRATQSLSRGKPPG